MVANGNIPVSQLALVDATHYASPGCAAAFHGFSAAMGGLTVGTAADAAYRDLAWQQYRWSLHASNPRLYPVAAVPGHSNHGLGQAIDIGNYYRYPHATLVAVGRRFGFVFDTPSELWHVTYQGAPNYRLTPASASTIPLISPLIPEGIAVSKLYHRSSEIPSTATKPTEYALAGDSVGTPANWLVTTSLSIAEGWALQLGAPDRRNEKPIRISPVNDFSIGLNDASWAQYSAAYLSPVKTA